MRPIFLAPVLALTLPVSAQAQPDMAVTELDRVVVVATRTQRSADDVPHTVDVIDRERMDELVVQDLRDLFRYEPGITVASDFGRFGISDIRIRGLGGNRVRIQTDGIAVPDAFKIGSFSNAGRNFVDMDTLKRVEVVRGPASSLYGSDALGGVVAFVTKDPADYLADDQGSYLGLRGSTQSSWDGRSAGATAAAGNGRWAAMAAVNRQMGHETENQGKVGGVGDTRTLPNPQDVDGQSLLGKLVFTPSDTQRLTLTVDDSDSRARTRMLTWYGRQALTGAVNDHVHADDRQARTRLSLAHEATGLGHILADELDWQLYGQNSRTTQVTLEERTLPAPTLMDRRERAFEFEQRTSGLQLNARKQIPGDSVQHDLAWGVDLSRTYTGQRRDGMRTYPLSGESTPVMLPDIFPVRDFPNSRNINAAAYLQDEISLWDGSLRLVPALRVDHYRLTPRLDDIFAGDNPGVELSSLRKTHASPKLGAVWHLGDAWSVFASYAQGFRSPPYNDVNIGFTNVMFGYTAVANPDLRPETSTGYEAGLRYGGSAVHASVSGYRNRYHDFIESLTFIGHNAEGLMVFQSRNVDSARIHGVEIKADVDLAALSPRLEGWRLNAAAAWSRGQNSTSHQPLESVDPATATLGLAYDDAAWGVELAGRFAARRDRLPDAPPGSSYFASPGYGVLDLYAHWQPSNRVRINAGLLNVGNRKYWAAGMLPLVPDGEATLDRYTAPGRSIALSLSVDW